MDETSWNRQDCTRPSWFGSVQYHACLGLLLLLQLAVIIRARPLSLSLLLLQLAEHQGLETCSYW